MGQASEIPKKFKEAKVKMLYKKNDKKNMSNYRPLSMTNHIGKIFERIVNNVLSQHLKLNNIISKSQCGFLEGHGTDTNLIRQREHLIDIIEKEGNETGN